MAKAPVPEQPSTGESKDKVWPTIAGILSAVAGLVLGLITYGYIMRDHDYFPGFLEAIPTVGIWLKFGLATVAGIGAFGMGMGMSWQGLMKNR